MFYLKIIWIEQMILVAVVGHGKNTKSRRVLSKIDGFAFITNIKEKFLAMLMQLKQKYDNFIMMHWKMLQMFQTPVADSIATF